MEGFNIIIPHGPDGRIHNIMTFPIPANTQTLVVRDKGAFSETMTDEMNVWADAVKEKQDPEIGGSLVPEILLLVADNAIMGMLLSMHGRVNGTIFSNPPRHFTLAGDDLDLPEL